jgi:hypothetical protein
MVESDKKICEDELKIATLIGNAVMLGVASSQIRMLGHPISEPPDKSDELQIKIISQAVNYIFAKKIETEGLNEDMVYTKASEILKSDQELEMLILRILFDIFCLYPIFEKDELGRQISLEYPKITQMLADGRKKYPKIFNDPGKRVYRTLVAKFADKYEPTMKENLLKFFQPV